MQGVRNPWNQPLSVEVCSGGGRTVYDVPMMKTTMDGEIK